MRCGGCGERWGASRPHDGRRRIGKTARIKVNRLGVDVPRWLMLVSRMDYGECVTPSRDNGDSSEAGVGMMNGSISGFLERLVELRRLYGSWKNWSFD